MNIPQTSDGAYTRMPTFGRISPRRISASTVNRCDTTTFAGRFSLRVRAFCGCAGLVQRVCELRLLDQLYGDLQGNPCHSRGFGQGQEGSANAVSCLGCVGTGYCVECDHVCASFVCHCRVGSQESLVCHAGRIMAHSDSGSHYAMQCNMTGFTDLPLTCIHASCSHVCPT
jgi:hypothetical protein